MFSGVGETQKTEKQQILYKEKKLKYDGSFILIFWFLEAVVFIEMGENKQMEQKVLYTGGI